MQSFRTALPRAASSVRTFSTTTPRQLARMQLIGRLADSPETQATSTGTEITRFALGVGSGRRDENGQQSHVSWFRVASFLEDGPQRQLLQQLPKGTQLFVEAEARMDSYEDKEGVKRTQINLIMRNFEALSRPQNRESANNDLADEPLAATA